MAKIESQLRRVTDREVWYFARRIAGRIDRTLSEGGNATGDDRAADIATMVVAESIAASLTRETLDQVSRLIRK